jgi:hypothetical protein
MAEIGRPITVGDLVGILRRTAGLLDEMADRLGAFNEDFTPLEIGMVIGHMAPSYHGPLPVGGGGCENQDSAGMDRKASARHMNELPVSGGGCEDQ